jgi:hypothetical protein
MKTLLRLECQAFRSMHYLSHCSMAYVTMLATIAFMSDGKNMKPSFKPFPG